MLTGVTSTLSDGATDWMTPNWPIPEGVAASRRTATRVTPGAISLSSSSHFPPMLYSKFMNPVALPPGRARLSTKPAPTGSTTTGNTIGTVRVACSNGPTVVAPGARMTSGASATNSAACLRISAASVVAQRVSMRTLRPMVQPNCCQPLQERPEAGLKFRIVRGCGQQHADAPHALGLLRARRERPRNSRTAQSTEKLPSPHARSPGSGAGIVRLKQVL